MGPECSTIEQLQKSEEQFRSVFEYAPFGICLAGLDGGFIQVNAVMPKMSGRELSQMLGSLRPGLKTIHMSGYTDDTVLLNGIHESSTTFLQKPFSLGTLAHKVHDTINGLK